MDRIIVTKLTSMHVYSNTYGETISIADVIKEMKNQKLANVPKEKLPALQNQQSGIRLKKNTESYMQNWYGMVFVDIDNKYGWSAESAQDYIKKLHEKLSKHPWYIGICSSSSGTGIHIYAYIPSKFHTQLEYYISAAVIYSRVTDFLSKIMNIDIQKLINDKIIDLHNYYNHAQLLSYSYGEFFVGKSFNPDEYRSLDNEYNTDEDYYKYIIKQKCLNTIMTRILIDVISSKSEFITTVEDLSYEYLQLPTTITYRGGYFFNFKYEDRLQLVYTLLNYYSKEDTYKVIDMLYVATYGYDIKYRKRMNEVMTIIKSEKQKRTPNPKTLRILKDSYGLEINYIPNNNKVVFHNDSLYDMEIKLGNLYLSDYMTQIMSSLGNLTVIEAPAGSGKTTAISSLNERLILTEPYTAIIKNKIENNKDLTDFGCLYGNKRITDEEYRNKTKFCCTPNNIIMLNADILQSLGIKYIFVDESHTIIGDAEYRHLVMGNFCSKLKEFIHAGIKVILLSGTPLNEFYYMYDNDLDLRFIKVKKESPYEKTLTIKHYETKEDKYTDLINNISDALIAGYKCFVPTNMGDLYVKKISNSVKLRYPELSTASITYYTKNHSSEKLNEDITIDGNIDNANIVFAGVSLSVGVDINYTGKCRIFFPDRVPDYNIEQFSARLRKTDKECYIYVVDDDNTYSVREYSYPYADFKYKSAEELINDYNQQKLFSEPVPIDPKTLEYYQFIESDFETGNYKINKCAWDLIKAQYNNCHYNSQLSVIISNCTNKYGFTVNDYTEKIKVNESEKRMDKKISAMTKKEEKEFMYRIVNNICTCSLTDERVRQMAATETNKNIKKIKNTMVEFLDKRIHLDIVTMILNETLDHKKKQFVMKNLNKFILLVDLYWSLNSKKQGKAFECYLTNIKDFVEKHPTCRRETRDKFIQKVFDEQFGDDKVIQNRTVDAETLFNAVVDCIETKKNHFSLRIRSFIFSMLKSETADIILYKYEI